MIILKLRKEDLEVLKTLFEERITKTSYCWVWNLRPTVYGYGQFKCRSLGLHLRAHRLSWMIYRGEIPEGKEVLHTCDNRICVKPDHLYLGTQKDNVRDMVVRGRAKGNTNAPPPTWLFEKSVGEGNGRAKLTEREVRDIFSLRKSGKSCRELGVAFNVSSSAIKAIGNGTIWRHLNLLGEAGD